MLIQACLNGMRNPDEHDALPVTPDELARDGAASVEAGARSLHVHVRGDDRAESLRPGDVDRVVAALRDAVEDVEISLSTGLWITDGDAAERLRCVREWGELPDLVSLNVGEEGWVELGELLAERGVGIEIGLAEPRHPYDFADSGLQGACVRALVEPQETTPSVAITTAGAIDGGLEDAGVDLPQLHHGTYRTTWAVLDAAVRRGRDIRIGFEDTFALPDARRARSNAELVAAAAGRYLSSSG